MTDPTPANGTYTGLNQNIPANDYAEVVKFITEKMDEILAIEAKTNGMNADPAFVQATGTAGTVKLATLETTGLGNYDKVKGYPRGGSSLTWQEYTLANDRAIGITVDRRDAQATGMLATASAVLAEEMRSHVIPEVDATRMAKLWYVLDQYKSANSNVKSGSKPSNANVITEIITGINSIADATGREDGMTIYVNAELRTAIDTSSEVTKNLDIRDPNTGFNSVVRSIRGNQIVFVPSARMFTKVALKDGYTSVYPDDSDIASDELDYSKYGFTSGDGAKEIYFAITSPGVANAVTAINAPKIISADVNQQYDGDTFLYRIFHDLIVPKNKCPGAYMYVKS